MNAKIDCDIEYLKQWIGRTETVDDYLSRRLHAQFGATFGMPCDPQEDGEISPLMIHWCLTQPIVSAKSLGTDGHPARGDFLPPVPLPRRMWAGSSLTFDDPLRVGDKVRRESRVIDVQLKKGSSGLLCFVTVDHVLGTDRGVAVRERANIVYRSLDSQQHVHPEQTPLRPVSSDVRWHQEITVDPVMLFRYAAITFNGHRIHYDYPYTTQEEGYPGLIVQGTLQATVLAEFAGAVRMARPRQFKIRMLKPLFDHIKFRLCAKESAEGLELWIEHGEGIKTVEAVASF